MNLKYLLDTNVLSEPVKDDPQSAVLEKIEKAKGALATASVCWHELLYGCYRMPESKKRKIIYSYLFDYVRPTLPLLPYDDRAAEWHAYERARLSKLGCVPSFADGQIASIAKVNGLILVTRNISDYARWEGLVLKNWHGG